MNAEMILASAQFVGLMLSFTLLLRARRLSAELWSAERSCQRLPTGRHVKQPSEIDRIFRTQER
jgi:hypothetical protein